MVLERISAIGHLRLLSLNVIEIQGTAEEAPFSKDQLSEMLEIGSSAIADIIEKQKNCLK